MEKAHTAPKDVSEEAAHSAERDSVEDTGKSAFSDVEFDPSGLSGNDKTLSSRVPGKLSVAKPFGYALATMMGLSACTGTAPTFDHAVATTIAARETAASMKAEQLSKIPWMEPLPLEYEPVKKDAARSSVMMLLQGGTTCSGVVTETDDENGFGTIVSANHCFFDESGREIPLLNFENMQTGEVYVPQTYYLYSFPDDDYGMVIFPTNPGNLGRAFTMPAVPVDPTAQLHPGDDFLLYGYARAFREHGFSLGHGGMGNIERVEIGPNGLFYHSDRLVGSGGDSGGGIFVPRNGKTVVVGINIQGSATESVMTSLAGYPLLRNRFLQDWPHLQLQR